MIYYNNINTLLLLAAEKLHNNRIRGGVDFVGSSFFVCSVYKRRISLSRLRFCLVIYFCVNYLRKIRTLLDLLASKTG